MMTTVYSLLREEYDFIIVDTPPSFTSEVIATVDVANWICMVAMFDALSLKNTRLGLDTLELMGHPADHMRVVLNRAGTNVGISDATPSRSSGAARRLRPERSRDPVSINEGVPIVLSGSRSRCRAGARLAGRLFVLARPNSQAACGEGRTLDVGLFRRKRG